MPEISRFLGIVIKMYYRDHAPPHFHAVYGDDELVVRINPIMILEGDAAARVRSMVLEWAALHQEELRNAWLKAKNLEPIGKIAPLPRSRPPAAGPLRSARWLSGRIIGAAQTRAHRPRGIIETHEEVGGNSIRVL